MTHSMQTVPVRIFPTPAFCGVNPTTALSNPRNTCCNIQSGLSVLNNFQHFYRQCRDDFKFAEYVSKRLFFCKICSFAQLSFH